MRRPMRWAAATVVLVLASWVISCSRTPTPQPTAVVERSAKRPVVFVPGVTGVELRDPVSKQTYWGTGRNLLGPRDRGYREARPILPGVGGRKLEAGEVILRLRVAGIFKKLVYQPLVELFERNGYRRGDLSNPSPDDDFFLFAYDWRQDNVESARRLARQLEALRVARGDSLLEIVLLCQSNGSHICRYFTKYRGATLDEAEAGVRSESRVEVSKLALIGSSNGGSLRVLRELNRGRKYVRWIGRVWAQEVLFTFLALFQDLPTYADDLFVDERGRSIDVDLFEASNWESYGWSIFEGHSQQRLIKRPRPELFGDRAAQLTYLQRSLDRTLRLHAALRADGPDLGSTRLYLVLNSHNSTPDRAVLVRREGEWATLFTGDPYLKKLSVDESRISTRGDGHATIESQSWLSSQEQSRLAWKPTDVGGAHFEMILEPATHNEILRILAD